MTSHNINVVGAGLAGCETAWQLSKKYIKGVSCHKCYDVRTKDQKERSLNRQIQIDNAELKNEDHSFKKIKYL